MEGDSFGQGIALLLPYFNPLPPHGGRPLLIVKKKIDEIISIHSLRMEGDKPWGAKCIRKGISIHSLRMEGDVVFCALGICQAGISIHSLRMEGDWK